MLSRKDKSSVSWDTHDISGNVFANPPTSSSSAYPGGFNTWILNVTEDTLPHVTSERQIPDTVLDPRCQSVPSVRNSFVPKREDFKGLWDRPTKTTDFGSSFWQIPYANNICLLEDKIQNWGMYLFTVSHGSYVIYQRSGDVGISGWSQILVFSKRKSNTRFWSTPREKCFSTEQDHPEYPLQEKGQSGGNESS